MKTFFSFLSLFLFSLIILFFFTPKILSSSFAKPFIEKILSKKAQNSIKIGKIDLTWKGPQNFSKITIENNNLSLFLEKSSIDLPLLTIFLHRNKIEKDLLLLKTSFHIANAKISQKDPSFELFFPDIFIKTENGLANLDLKASTSLEKATNNISILAKANPMQDFFELSLIFKDLPSELFNPFTKKKLPLPFSQIVASPITSNLEVNFSKKDGTIQGKFSSPALTTAFNFNKIKNQILLTSNWTINYIPTKEVSNFLLKVAPRFIEEELFFQNPVKLSIESRDFLASFPFRLEDLKIGVGKLEIGKITTSLGPSISSISNLFTTGLFSSNSVELIFTPIDFSITNSSLHLERFDFLINNSHLCMWGDIDLKTEKLKLTLGIVSSALMDVLPPTKLPDDFVLQIPIYGTLSSPKFDQKKAAAKIALLIALSTAPGGWLSDILSLSHKMVQEETPKQRYSLESKQKKLKLPFKTPNF